MFLVIAYATPILSLSEVIFDLDLSYKRTPSNYRVMLIMMMMMMNGDDDGVEVTGSSDPPKVG